MLVAERTRLGDALDEWLKRQRVTVAHVVKTTGVSRNTIWLIQQGVTSEPEAETLRKIARGLATDPHSGDFDRAVYLDALKAFSRAAGLPDLTVEIPTSDLVSEIRSIVKDRSKAEAYADFIRRHPKITPGQLKLVEALLDNIPELQ